MPRMTSQIAYLGLITTIGLLLGACGGSPPRPDPSTPQPAAATQPAPESSKLPNSYALADVLIRLAGYLLSAAVLMLGFLWAAFSPRRQGWHDKLAGTIVVAVGEN